MMNSFFFSRRSELLVSTNSESTTHLRAPGSEAVRVAAALRYNTCVTSLELDFSSCTSTSPATADVGYSALAFLFETTQSIQRIQLFGARGESAVQHLHVLLRAVQQNPRRNIRLELVCCRLLAADFAYLPSHCALRGVRVLNEQEVTAALATNTQLTSVRLTAYLGMELLIRILQHLPTTVQHVAVYHHGTSGPLLQSMAQLKTPHVQVEYMQFPHRDVLNVFLSRFDTQKQHLTFSSCGFYATDPWSVLQGASLTWQGLCPPLLAPIALSRLDVSKVVIDRQERLEQVICQLGNLKSLVLGDVSESLCALLLEHVPLYTNLQALKCSLAWKRSAQQSAQVRQAFRKNASITQCSIEGLTPTDAAAVQWYTAERNSRLVELEEDCLDCPKLLPHLFRFSLDAHSSPTQVCRSLIEALPR